MLCGNLLGVTQLQTQGKHSEYQKDLSLPIYISLRSILPMYRYVVEQRSAIYLGAAEPYSHTAGQDLLSHETLRRLCSSVAFQLSRASDTRVTTNLQYKQVVGSTKMLTHLGSVDAAQSDTLRLAIHPGILWEYSCHATRGCLQHLKGKKLS